MIEIISGTNRPNSRTLEVARLIHGIYGELGHSSQILDLKEIPWRDCDGSSYPGGQPQPDALRALVDRVTNAEGLVVVTPEYNGSFPGALKYFIDCWNFPETFEYRPVCFVGLGGRFGGLRPVEHLQGVFSYRNAFMLPQRIFLMNIFGLLKDGRIQDKLLMDLMHTQAKDFVRFIKALQSQGLDANSFLKNKPKK